MRTLIIAECGSCHEGNLDKAKRLIFGAADCGADCAKFQYWSSSAELAYERNAPELESMYDGCRLPADWLPELKDMCDTAGVEFMCTTYLNRDIAVVAEYVSRFKVSSFEAPNKDFVQAHRQYGKPIMVSCGMNETEIDYNGDMGTLVYYMHCVSGYPTPVGQLNLEILHDRRYSGFSDHTTSLLTGAYAVAAGAFIVEKHIRLKDTSEKCPDFGHSICCDSDMECIPEFLEYCLEIREAESAMGDGIRRIQPCERDNVKYRRG